VNKTIETVLAEGRMVPRQFDRGFGFTLGAVHINAGLGKVEAELIGRSFFNSSLILNLVTA
jgi:hypothetical protein